MEQAAQAFLERRKNRSERELASWRIVDAQVHIWGRGHAGAAVARPRDENRHRDPPIGADELLRMMDGAGGRACDHRAAVVGGATATISALAAAQKTSPTPGGDGPGSRSKSRRAAAWSTPGASSPACSARALSPSTPTSSGPWLSDGTAELAVGRRRGAPQVPLMIHVPGSLDKSRSDRGEVSGPPSW